jgi:hypothetical protein
MTMKGHGNSAMESTIIVVRVIIIIIIIIIKFRPCAYMFIGTTGELTSRVEGVFGPLFCW